MKKWWSIVGRSSFGQLRLRKYHEKCAIKPHHSSACSARGRSRRIASEALKEVTFTVQRRFWTSISTFSERPWTMVIDFYVKGSNNDGQASTKCDILSRL
jgi:hypothetical protein